MNDRIKWWRSPEFWVGARSIFDLTGQHTARELRNLANKRRREAEAEAEAVDPWTPWPPQVRKNRKR